MTTLSPAGTISASECSQKVRRVISTCIARDIEVWSATQSRIPKCIEAREYLLICPAHEMERFRARTGAKWTICSDEDFCSPSDFKQIDDNARGVSRARMGWLLQQFLKINACIDPVLQDDELVLIWDADTIPLRRLRFASSDGKVLYYRSPEYHLPYFRTLEKLLGPADRTYPSFIAQCFPTRVRWARELVHALRGCGSGSYVATVMDALEGVNASEFAEYETMGAWNLMHHADQMGSATGRWSRGGAKWIGHRPSSKFASICLRVLSLRYDYIAVESWQKPHMHAALSALVAIGRTFRNPRATVGNAMSADDRPVRMSLGSNVGSVVTESVIQEEGSMNTSKGSLLRWSYISTLSTAALQLIAATVITRFLQPKDYGLAAMAMVCSSLASYFTQLGMDRAIIQRRHLTDGNIRAAFTLSFATGLVGFAGLAAASHGLALYFREPRLPKIIIAFGLNLFFQSSAMIAGGLLRRELQIRRLAICDITAYLVSTFGLGLPMAIKGYGVWALVVSTVSQSLFAAIGYFISRPHSVRLTILRENYRDITGFGAKVSVTTMVEALSGSADTLILGRLVTPQVLGLYNRSLTLSMQPIYALSTGLSRVFHPSIARAAERTIGECRSMLQSSQRQLMGVVIPVCIGAAVAAPTLIPAVFGRRWAGSIPVYQALCIDAALDATFHLPTIQLEVLSKFRSKLIVQSMYGVLLAASAIFTAPYGIVKVAYVFVVLQLVRTLWLHWLSARSLDTGVMTLLDAWRPGLLCGAVVGSVIYVLQAGLNSVGPEMLLVRLTLIIVGAATAALITYRSFFYDSVYKPWINVFASGSKPAVVMQMEKEVGVA